VSVFRSYKRPGCDYETFSPATDVLARTESLIPDLRRNGGGGPNGAVRAEEFETRKSLAGGRHVKDLDREAKCRPAEADGVGRNPNEHLGRPGRL